jgi:hypothetical protein
LQEAAIYAQELLNSLHEPTISIEPRAGEEILSITDEGGYTRVVKRPEGHTDAYAYQVHREPQIDGDEELEWVLLGRVDPDDL